MCMRDTTSNKTFKTAQLNLDLKSLIVTQDI